MFTKREATSLCLATLLAFAVSPVAWGAKLYKWVDHDGNVTYQDQPPPEDAQSVSEYRDPEVSGPAAAGAARNSPVTLYVIEKCDACDLVRLFLQKNGIPFSEIDVGNDADAQKELLENVGQLGVPTLLIGKTPLAGYNASSIEAELRKAKYLPPLEAEAEVEVEVEVEETTVGAEQPDEADETAEQSDSLAPDTTAGNF
ncbi:MAG: DUF4124 domain-containing protein [Gammaproteobacteria bacterium]|nr:DUF4124 domain-containing protein [Gammaproteobacteria bacterium]